MHEQHRQRMKTRFLREGFENFAPHEILEMLLYYAKPQGDVNPLAHELFEKYENFYGVFEAPVEELSRLPGVGEHTAFY